MFCTIKSSINYVFFLNKHVEWPAALRSYIVIIRAKILAVSLLSD